MKARGFHGSSRVVSEWATRRRRAEKVSDQNLQKVPSARTIARLMTMARDHLSKADSVTVAAIEAGVLALVEARTLVERFHAMIRMKIEADSNPGSQRRVRACSHPSPQGSQSPKPRSAQRLCSHGQTVRPRDKSTS